MTAPIQLQRSAYRRQATLWRDRWRTTHHLHTRRDEPYKCSADGRKLPGSGDRAEPNDRATRPVPQKPNTRNGVDVRARVDPRGDPLAHTDGPTCPVQSRRVRKAPAGHIPRRRTLSQGGRGGRCVPRARARERRRHIPPVGTSNAVPGVKRRPVLPTVENVTSPPLMTDLRPQTDHQGQGRSNPPTLPSRCPPTGGKRKMSESDLMNIGIDDAAASAQYEIGAGRYRLARVWLDLAIELQRDLEGATTREHAAARDQLVRVPILREGSTCGHGYGTYIAGGQRWHRSTGGLCNDQSRPYATALCAGCTHAIEAMSWHSDQVPGDAGYVRGLISWETWRHAHGPAADHEPIPAANTIQPTEHGATLLM